MTAQFTEPVVEQIVALIYRDQSTYLSLFGETEPIQQFSLATLWGANFPALAVFDVDDLPDPDSFDTISQDIHIKVQFQVNHSDRNIVTKKCRSYLGAIHLLLRNIDIGQNGKDMQTPLPLPASLTQIGTTTTGVPLPSMVQRIRIVAHRFTQFGQVKGKGFAMKAEMDLLVQLEEKYP